MRQLKTALGNVALKIDAAIDISKNNPLFTSAEEFSINLTVPRGPNEHIFGYRNRLASAGTNLTIDAQFNFFGREKINGAIELISASDDEFEILLKGSRNNFFFKFGAVNIHDLDLGEEYFVPDNPYPTEEEFVTEMYYTTILQRDWICFPCNVQDEYVKATNPWDFNLSKFIFPTNFAPYMRLWRALHRLFNYHGYTITESWFELTQERKNIVIYRKEHTEDPFLMIIEFFPKITITEFISELENFFPITFCIDSKLNTVRIMGDDTLLSDSVSGKLDEFTTGKPKITFNDTQNGYELKYNYPSDDSVMQDVDYADEINSAVSASKYDFPEPSALSDLMRLSLADGGYYKVKESGTGFKWERVGSVAINVRSGDGEITRETKIYPAMNEQAGFTQDYVMTNPEGGTETHPLKIFFQFPVCKGDGLYDTGYYWVNNFRLMVYRGYDTPMRDPAGMTWALDHILKVPMANFVARKMNGDAWADNNLELRWDGDMGLRGAETIAFLNGARKITATLVMHHVYLEKIDLTKVYLLQGQKVIIDELVIHYGTTENVTIDATLMMHQTV